MGCLQRGLAQAQSTTGSPIGIITLRPWRSQQQFWQQVEHAFKALLSGCVFGCHSLAEMLAGLLQNCHEGTRMLVRNVLQDAHGVQQLRADIDKIEQVHVIKP